MKAWISRIRILFVLSACSAGSTQRSFQSESAVQSETQRRLLHSGPTDRPSKKDVVAPPNATSALTAEGCATEGTPLTYSEPRGPKRFYSVEGYLARRISVSVRGTTRRPDATCITVLWPPGETNTDGQPSNVARLIDEPWFQLIRNTLARIPPEHAATLRRIVIDNRPKQHGIASHDRGDPDDGRDGHTIWLHEHLFRDANHWAGGTWGSYFAYHLSESDRTLQGAAPNHTLFSPVLLHEVGHLVMYNIVNAARVGRARAVVPKCAETCIDTGTCSDSSQASEAGCITPYCTPFRFRTSTENWAEQYRFYYQSAATRGLLESARAGCLGVLAELEQRSPDGALEAPWERGLPDGPRYRRSLWTSCGGRACKPW